MKLILIAAMSKNRVIGADGQLPWYIPEDFQWFKNITTGHPIIMGRRTFDSIGKPLPKRVNIILTQDKTFVAPKECLVCNSLEDALSWLQNDAMAFVIGGESVYSQAMPYTDTIYLTIVQRHLLGDTFFPEIDENIFEKVSVKLKDTQPPTNFEIWERFPHATKKPLEVK